MKRHLLTKLALTTLLAVGAVGATGCDDFTVRVVGDSFGIGDVFRYDNCCYDDDYYFYDYDDDYYDYDDGFFGFFDDFEFEFDDDGFEIDF